MKSAGAERVDSEKNGLGVSGGFLGEFYRSSLLFLGIFVAFGEQFCLAFRVSIGCCLYVVPFLLLKKGYDLFFMT